MGERSRKGSNLDAISQTAKHGRSNVSSRKLPATGRWGNVPGNGLNLDAISRNPANKGDCTSVPGNFPQRGDGRTFRERFKSGCNLTYCQTWEINRQFQETSRNGAMEKRSGKGSNLAAISHTAKHGKSNVSSRKLPAAGRWKKVPGNGSNTWIPHLLRNLSKFRNPQT